jgi:SAM-dependent methyltransferase
MFRAFRREQTDGAAFYRVLAEDSAAQVAAHVDLEGAGVLDVGGGPGYFHQAFAARGATYVGIESDAGELTVHQGRRAPLTALASGTRLPFADGSWDVVYCSNVLEHVATPRLLADELLRVVRPGGTLVLSYTLWWGPHGGHETSPWHYLGGHRARRRYERRHGHPPKNVFGTSMFAARAAPGVRWARTRTDAELVAAFPRYHPWWAHWVVHLPVLREVLVWNLVLVLRKR